MTVAAPVTAPSTPPRAVIVLLLGISAAAVVAAFLLPPIAQEPGYHRFADGRTVLGIANFWNVVSNLAFVLVGVHGIATRSKRSSAVSGVAYRLFCVAAILIGIGSGYYHHSPTTATLLWDRLPMTLAFMSLLAVIVSDRISPRLGQRLLWPLIAAGIASVLYWYASELRGAGDLRAYGLTQFLPVVLIPVMLLTSRRHDRRAAWLWATLLTYGLAKVAEHLDLVMAAALGGFSGHTLKHLLAALAMHWAVRAMHSRDP